MMPAHTPSLCLRALCLVAASGLAASAFANTGRVEFVSGSALLRNSQGERPLSRGIELSSGDSVLTAASGRVQIRFSDGAFVSLQPETEFSVDQYRFGGAADGTERSVFGLVKGAMRTVTGLVGRVNRDNYQIRTPNATIGIRGTGGIVSVNSNGTSIVGTSGTWVLTNQAGSIQVPAGRAAIATTDQSKPPQETSDAPQTPPAPAASRTKDKTSEEPSISLAESRSSTGQSLAAASNLKQDVSIALTIVGNAANLVTPITFASNSSATESVAASVNSSGQLTGYTTNYSSGVLTNTATITGTHAEGGSAQGVTWGRWSNATWTSKTEHLGTTTTSSYSVGSNGGIHYVYGSAPTAMPTSGTFTYNLMGATSPTLKSEGTPGTLNSATLTGAFTATGGTIAINMSLTAASNNYTVSTGSSAFTGTTFSTFGAHTTGGPCTGGCNTSVNGAFSGAGASNAGISYSISLPGDTLGGVAAFKK